MSGKVLSIVIPTYRDGARARCAAEAMLAQVLPGDIDREVIVVDDGSDDDTQEHLARCTDPRVRVVRLPNNIGRSAARNAGAAQANGLGIVFIDCDCLPTGADFLAAHVTALAKGAVASTGEVTGCDGGFWERYQREASARRARQHNAGVSYAGTSQNLAVDRAAFERIGGFDTGYTRYGFEDRDLLLRLATLGRIAWTSEAQVRHLDALSLAQVSRKMREAGEFSSARFASRHPRAYIALGYARFDVRTHAWLRPVGHALRERLPLAARAIDRLLPMRAVPYVFKAFLVRVVTGLSYSVGTLHASEQATR
jgi:glycosyltransferase involved in cell wall biosynthesis